MKSSSPSSNHRRQRTPRFRSVSVLRQWRGAAAPERWTARVAKLMRSYLILLLMLLPVGCERRLASYRDQRQSLLSDTELAEKLAGTWISDNNREFSYQSNGLAMVRGTVTNEWGMYDFEVSGVWFVTNGCLHTRATNSTYQPLPEASRKELSKELLSVTDREMTVRSSSGHTYTFHRKQ